MGPARLAALSLVAPIQMGRRLGQRRTTMAVMDRQGANEDHDADWGQDSRRRLEAQLACIEAHEATVQAWIQRTDPAALRAALDQAGPGPLRGFTLGVKDIMDTAELTTERGSPIYAGRRAGVDAACVTLARRAGAVVAGKTATTEFAVLTPTVTTNPLDPSRTPGGSSSGSAAAVAAGMVRVALGTQTAGSVIRPASFCGVAGFKPTYQRVPLAGVYPFAPSLDTVGYFANTVPDLARVHLALTGEAAPAGQVGSGRRLRIGLYRSHQFPRADPHSVAALESAAAVWRAAGAEVEDLEDLAELAEVADHAQTIMLQEGWRSLAWERTHHPGLLSAGLTTLLAQGEATTAAGYNEAQRAVQLARRAFDATMARFDGLLTPAVAGEAPPLDSTGDPVFCRVWTALGAPALTLPAGMGTAGLPIGVQLIGARWADGALLAVAASLESALAAQPG